MSMRVPEAQRSRRVRPSVCSRASVTNVNVVDLFCKRINRFQCKLAKVSSIPGQRHATVNPGGQEVKGQGHKRPKLDLKAWRRHHSPTPPLGSSW